MYKSALLLASFILFVNPCFGQDERTANLSPEEAVAQVEKEIEAQGGWNVVVLAKAKEREKEAIAQDVALTKKEIKRLMTAYGVSLEEAKAILRGDL